VGPFIPAIIRRWFLKRPYGARPLLSEPGREAGEKNKSEFGTCDPGAIRSLQGLIPPYFRDSPMEEKCTVETIRLFPTPDEALFFISWFQGGRKSLVFFVSGLLLETWGNGRIFYFPARTMKTFFRTYHHNLRFRTRDPETRVRFGSAPTSSLGVIDSLPQTSKISTGKGYSKWKV